MPSSMIRQLPCVEKFLCTCGVNLTKVKTHSVFFSACCKKLLSELATKNIIQLEAKELVKVDNIKESFYIASGFDPKLIKRVGF